MKRQRYFQWLEGDLAGNVETLKDIECVEGEYFYNFVSGEVCNVKFISPMTRDIRSLKGKVMVEIINPNDKWRSEIITTHTYKYMDPTAGEQTVEYPPLEDITGAAGNGNELTLNESNLGKKKFYPPTYKGEMFPLPSFSEYAKEEIVTPRRSANVVIEEKEVPVPTQVQQPTQQVSMEPIIRKEEPKPQMMNSVPVNNDPVYILAKTCKKHDTEINLTLNINLPSKAIYTLAENEFDNGGQKFVSYLVDEIDPKIILSALKVALLDSYGSE